jgi:uncharacterized membrane protein
MRSSIRLSIVVFLLLLFLLPILFGELMAGGLAKLNLSPGTALVLMMGIIFGGVINIPVHYIESDQPAPVHPLAVFGISDVVPRLWRTRRRIVVAVNVGGCLIPAGLALYEFLRIVAMDTHVLFAVVVASAINVFASYRLARPVPGIGIAMPGLVSPLLSAGMAILFAPDQSAPVAFIAGVVGPLVGADLLHLKDIGRIATGMLSIGGAGTFDGIVLSGIVAAYLA